MKMNDMERVTIKRKIPPRGYFMTASDEELRKVRSTDILEVYTRLQAYEDTGLTPEEIITLQVDNARIHKLIDELENGLRKEFI